jgi:hypothetical protein
MPVSVGGMPVSVGGMPVSPGVPPSVSPPSDAPRSVSAPLSVGGVVLSPPPQPAAMAARIANQLKTCPEMAPRP